MSKASMSPKQKGYIGLGVMAVLSAATIWGTEPLYKFIDNFGKEAIYTAGTYTGKAEGFGGEVVVDVTVSTTSIESLKITADGETPGIGSNAVEQLPASIIGKGSTEVDAISGATITSDAVKSAVDQALALARGEEVVVETTAAVEETTKASVSYSFTPGTYTASAQGYGGDVKVEVTVSDTAIVEIKADGADETPEIGGNALKKLPEKMVEAQSADVDGVSGATITGDAVKEAVKAALAQAEGGTAAETTAAETTAAGGDTTAAALSFVPGTYSAAAAGYGGDVKVEITVSESRIEEVKADGADETPEIGGNALDKLPAKILEAQSADVDAVSGATVTSDAILAAVKDALSQAAASGEAKEAAPAAELKAGTYTGEAEGYAGKVTAEVTITEAGIADIKVKGDDETPEIGGNAINKLPAKMIEAKSADVDAVSGATITSEAIIEAVNQALEQAKG